MSNIEYKQIGPDVVVRQWNFIRGVKDKRLGRKVPVELTFGEDNDVLSYEHGRALATMAPGISAKEWQKPSRRWPQYQVDAWNNFCAAINFGKQAK